jgi:NAD(P)H-hydrate epimerase
MSSYQDIETGFLNAQDAAALDAELMSSPGFSLEQLMELAGLSVAEAVYEVVPLKDSTNKILIVCGPGNNGGDGLVAARHLVMFGYKSVVVYPKQSSKQHFINLVQQCRDVNIPVLESMPDDLLTEGEYSALVDSMFGFSFHGTLREPFGTIMAQFKEAQETLKIPAISVDIPSGWNVNGGDEANTGFKPDVLISLTAPKLAARSFTGRHFIGGRFVPPKLSEKYNIKVRRTHGCVERKCALFRF